MCVYKGVWYTFFTNLPKHSRYIIAGKLERLSIMFSLFLVLHDNAIIEVTTYFPLVLLFFSFLFLARKTNDIFPQIHICGTHWGKLFLIYFYNQSYYPYSYVSNVGACSSNRCFLNVQLFLLKTVKKWLERETVESIRLQHVVVLTFM